MGLDLPDEHVVQLKKWLKKKDVSGKHLMRFLIREHLKKEGMIADHENSSYLKPS